MVLKFRFSINAERSLKNIWKFSTSSLTHIHYCLRLYVATFILSELNFSSTAINISRQHIFFSGPGGAVGIAAGRSGDRIPAGAKFFAPVQTGPGAQPASCTMDTGSFPGVKSGRGVMLTPHFLLVPLVMKK